MIVNWNSFLETVGSIPIKNIQSYIDGMGTSYQDKLFFLKKIKPDVIVDFGCANGLILSKINEYNSKIKLIGYDLDKSMLSSAKSNLPSDAILTDNWEIIKEELTKYKSPALILSSVIHEVYSYSSSMTVKKFWQNQVFGGDFKWICIRDMIPSVSMNKKEKIEFEDDVKKVREKSDPKYLRSFEDRWGKIDEHYRRFIHYLLKYKYVDNWKREVNENYLPVSLETVKKKIPNTYRISYIDSFILPYLHDQVKKDFDVDIDHTTHTKIIIENLKK